MLQYSGFTSTAGRLKRLTVFACILLLVISLIPSSFAAGEKEEPKRIRVGYYENEVFQEGAKEGAVKTGYAYEYYRKISEYTGWEYEYVYGGFNELYEMFLSGEIDLLAGLAWKEDRVDLIGYPDAPMGSESYNLVKRDNLTDVTVEPATMNGKTFGVLKSAVEDKLREYLAKNGVEAKIIPFDDYEELFAAFDAGKIDILAAEGDGARGRDHAEHLLSFDASDYYLCVSKQNPGLLAELNTAQSQLAAEEPGFITSLKEKYYPISVSAQAFSEAEKEWINTHSAIEVGYLDNFMPFSGTDQNGEPTGMVTDLVPKMFDSLNLSDIAIHFHKYDNYDKMITDLTDGKIDTAFPIGGGPYYCEDSGIWQSAVVTSSYTEIVYKGKHDEGKKHTFAVNENNRIQYYFVITNYPDAEVTYYPTIEECLSAVLNGEVNFTVVSGLRVNEIMKNSKYKALSSHQIMNVDEHSFGVDIGNKGMLKLLNRGISLVGEKYLQELPFRYTSDLSKYGLIDALKDHMFLFISAIVAIAGLVIFILVRDARRKKKETLAKEAALEELEERNRELTENRAALASALVDAEQASKAKTTFLNSMSHDIRTPMNAIMGFTALASSHIDNKEQVQGYLEKISISSQHLLSLINDVLDMSRIESGKVSINETPVHLPDILRDLHTIIQPNIASKQLELFIDTQNVLHEDVITDRMRLNQILLNILSNAIKFTPDGGKISFRLIEKPSADPEYAALEFRVKDNGIGMSKEFQKTVFDSFTREKTSTVSGIQGTGLGMAITKNIVDLMGGEITVESEEGKGSEFTVSLSCKIATRSEMSDQILIQNGKRVLLADDDANNCLSVCTMLRDLGMSPSWTDSGKEAVARAKDAMEHGNPFDVYMIDWMIPDQNGIETTRQIRRIVGDSAPIIMMTAYDYSDIEEEAREAGVTKFCLKPLFLSDLKHLLSLPLANQNKQETEKKEKMDFSGKRLLLAEDNEMNQIIAVAIFEDHGFEVEIADDGAVAVEKVKEAPAGYYDIILMDIQMPRMDGYEATREIRRLKDKEKANIPIVAVTANAFEEDRIAAIEAGMNAHMAKPYDVPTIMDTLNRLF